MQGEGNPRIKGARFPENGYKMMTLRLILVVINLSGKNQGFKSHSNREASMKYLVDLRLVHNNIHSQSTLEQCYKGKKA